MFAATAVGGLLAMSGIDDEETHAASYTDVDAITRRLDEAITRLGTMLVLAATTPRTRAKRQ